MSAKKSPKNQLSTEAEEPVSRLPRVMWYVILLSVAVVVLGVSTFLAWKHPVMSWEQTVFHYINGWPESWRTAVAAITMLGSTWMAAVAVAATALAKMYWLSWRLAFSILAGYGPVLVLKLWLERPRPEGLYPDVHLRIGETLAGFPSGHSMIITVIMLTLLPFMPKVWRWIFAGLLIAVVALSRVYLGVHAPLDIVAGASIGAIVVCTIRLMPAKLQRIFRLG